jgi:hypothetical protein
MTRRLVVVRVFLAFRSIEFTREVESGPGPIRRPGASSSIGRRGP